MTPTVVVRRLLATPTRPAAQTWLVLRDLISRPDSEARRDLDAIAGVATSLIADEAARESPIVVYGEGPRLRVYCLYDEDAILGEDAAEGVLAWSPTDGDWRMSLPCAAEDLEWVRGALAGATSRVTARDKAEKEVGEDQKGAGALSLVRPLGPVDAGRFLRA